MGTVGESSIQPWVPVIPRLIILKIVHMYFVFVMVTTFLSLNAAQRGWCLSNIFIY